MNSMTNGEKVEGAYWLGQLNIPKYVKSLMVLDSLGLTPEQQVITLRTGQEEISVMRIPLVAIGYVDEESIHNSVLSAMGYTEEDLPVA